ncbi:MAG: hypothetical protein HYR62_00585 [Actinobacteria bacterium]|nr:hypothetical protein [Actinomycetota bacterium]MBI3687859.1 hypothetical protein [Actinomycetota bacterium]
MDGSPAAPDRVSQPYPGREILPSSAEGAEGAEGALVPAGRWFRPVDPETVTAGELGVLLAASGVAALAVSGLAMAHLSRFTLVTAGLGALGLLAVLAGLARLTGPRPRIVWDLPGLLLLGAAGLLALWMFLPGFHYAAGDRDPGGYMMTGAMISRHGAVTITDPLLTAHLPVQYTSPGALFAGVWVSDPAAGAVTPQFYHLWPALLAVSFSVHGFAGMANTDPLIGVLAVLVAVALARRLGGVVAAGTAGLLLSLHMMEVWQAKYPTAEILTQLLFLAALLGLAISAQTRWRWPALVAGIMVSVGWLARADGLLLVLLAIGGLATLHVLRRLDARGWWFAGGLAAVLPYAAYQAYGPAGLYTRLNKVPGLPTVLAAVGVCVVGAVVLRPLLGRLARRVGEITGSDRWQRWLGGGVVAVCVGLFGLGLVRPAFGIDLIMYGKRQIRSFDEQSLYRLSWFFTWPGLLLVLAGVAFVALRRWRPDSWLLVGTTLAFLPLYAWHARNSPYLMWWGRRYVSTVVPGMVLLMALALAGLWALRGRFRLPARATAGALTAFLTVVYLHQSLPVRQHDEWGGSYFVSRDIAALAGDARGVFLWEPASYCCAAPQSLLASPLWLVQDQLSVLLPGKQDAVPRYVSAYVAHFTDQPVFLVYEKGEPPAIPGIRATPVREFAGMLPRWDESSIYRPAHQITLPYHFTVYRVTRSG